jgi:hypothetical protein
MKKNAWELFEEQFKEGDAVIVILDDDRYDWGTLDWDSVKIILRDPMGRRRAHTYRWEHVVIMCHDGFPVRKLLGADGSRSVMLEKTEFPERVREILENENEIKEEKAGKLGEGLNLLQGKIGGLFPKLGKEIQKLEKLVPKFRQFGILDPFWIECGKAQLFNRGNSGPQFERSPWIETLVLENADGAVAHLWDLSSIFYAE